MKSSFNHSNNDDICLTIVELNSQPKVSFLFPKIDQMFDECKTYLIGTGSNANIRAFYMVVLKIIFKEKQKKQSNNDFGQISLLNQFKKLLYRQSTILTCIKNIPKIKVQNKSKNGTTLTTIETKKLIGQFLNELLANSTDKNRLQHLFNKYSFMHNLFTVFMRSLLWLQFDISSATDYNQNVSDNDVFSNLGHLFGIQNINVYESIVSITDFIIGIYPMSNFRRHHSQTSLKCNRENIYFIKQRIQQSVPLFNTITQKIVEIGQNNYSEGGSPRQSLHQIALKKLRSFQSVSSQKNSSTFRNDCRTEPQTKRNFQIHSIEQTHSSQGDIIK